MHSRHAEAIFEFISCLFFLNSGNIYVLPKLTLVLMGLKVTTLSQEHVSNVPIVKLKIL